MTEFEFIEGIKRSFAAIGDQRIVGIGDDCAVMQTSDTEAFVITTDMLVEGVHFLRHATSARQLGVKSLAVNLSDIAAMGARPVASFLSIALPADCRGRWAEEFIEGYRQLSDTHRVRLAGGDTTASVSGVAISVTAIGKSHPGFLKFRSGARPGDIIVVAGVLGESAAGLRDILAGRFDTPLADIHRSPVPQVAEGQWFGAQTDVHAMIDLSDGLASDLRHILKASKVGARIDLEAVPHATSIDDALTGGEDYKLLTTIAPEAFTRLAEAYNAHFATPLYPIGRIVEGSPEVVWHQNGTPVRRDWHGFEHF